MVESAGGAAAEAAAAVAIVTGTAGRKATVVERLSPRSFFVFQSSIARKCGVDSSVVLTVRACVPPNAAAMIYLVAMYRRVCPAKSYVLYVDVHLRLLKESVNLAVLIVKLSV